MDKKLGLVFSGGGGKGAYEVGVWKALKEFGIDKNVVAVAGTSVGGLNGALFLQGNYEKAEQLWNSISPEKILTLDFTKIAEAAVKYATKIAIPGVTAKLLLNMASYLRGKGWFTQEGLEALIRDSNACSAVAGSNIPFYVCALNGRNGKLELPLLTGKSEEEITLWLLASAAIPLIFGSVKINGQYYYDGGVLPTLSNNTPFEPLITKLGCTHIISIYLDNAPLMIKAREAYPDVEFCNIVPVDGFKGGVFSSLNFTQENAKKLIKLGYTDTKRILAQFKCFQDSEENFVDASVNVNKSTYDIDKQIQLNKQLRIQGTEENFELILNTLAKEIELSERKLIDNSIESFIDDNFENSKALLNAAFAGITTLASTEGRIKSQLNQGHLSRIWGGITGKNSKLQAEISWDLNRSIYANQVMLQKLSERSALTLEAMAFMLALSKLM